VVQEGYLPTRDTLLNFVHQAANEFGSSAVLVWQIFAWPVGMQPAGSYNFDWTSDTTGRAAMSEQVTVAAQKVLGLLSLSLSLSLSPSLSLSLASSPRT
jgi:hypothetical protein